MGMVYIAANNKRLMEKYFLGFLGRHLVPFPVLVCVGFIPLKSDATLQWILGRHEFSI
jgi:hypothetical protein